MAHKKGQTSSRNGRESASQRLGVKIWGGQKIVAGNKSTVSVLSPEAYAEKTKKAEA